MRRSRLQSRWSQFQFRELLYGVPRPLDPLEGGSGRREAWGLLSPGSSVTGTPAREGVYVGAARVVVALEEAAAAIRRGDVLITVSTDIGWSPYFPLLGAIVTELGGLISHGTVVAREYGLPCVVAAEGATGAFASGDLVEVDGRKGTVTKLERAE